MPTPSERRALLFVAAVAALGLGVRGLRAFGAGQGSTTPSAALAAQIAAVDSAVTVGGRTRRARTAPSRLPATTPASSGHRETDGAPSPARAAPEEARPLEQAPIDVDEASAEDLDRLPGIGPALARRIVEDRDANGPFGSTEGLQRVRGIGPALAARLTPFVTFSGLPRQPSPR